jgi:hypothetical protein
MTSGVQPSRALLIAAGTLTQVIGATCLVLALSSLPVAHDLESGMTGVVASIIASLAAIIFGTFVWRGNLVALALSAGLDVGFGIGLPRGGSAIGAMLRILPQSEAEAAETVILVAAILMFVAGALCILAVPSALKLRAWARAEIAKSGSTAPGIGAPPAPHEWPIGTDTATNAIDEAAPTRERPPLPRPSLAMPAERQSGSTLRGFGAVKLIPTHVIRVDAPGRSKPLVIIGVAVTLIAVGVIVITAVTGSSKPQTASTSAVGSSSGSSSGSATGLRADAAIASSVTPILDDAAPATDAVRIAEPIDAFDTRFHAALATAAPADLALLFAPTSFGFGVEANDLAESRDAIVAQLRADLGEPPPKGFTVSTRFSRATSDADIGWLAEELTVGGKTFVVSAVVGLDEGVWTIHALHWAQAMPNATAYRLVREGEHAIPDAIPDAHDESALATAMRTAFASKPSFVAATSARADAFNFGSAGERLERGETIQKVFGRIRASIHLRDAVKVGAIGERGGWGVANVDFTDADKDGTEVTQTFRVLAAWVKEEAGWRIVQTQWSNAR